MSTTASITTVPVSRWLNESHASAPAIPPILAGVAQPPTPYGGSDFQPRSEGPRRNDPVKTIYVPPGAAALGMKRVVDTATTELVEIGKRRGFVVTIGSPATPDLWAEDNAILYRNGNGRISLLVSSMPGHQFSAARDAVMALFSGTAEQRGNLQEELGDLKNLGRVFVKGISRKTGETARKAGWDVRSTEFAIDGGNMLTMADAKGGTVVLIGRDSLLVNWMVQRQAGKLSHTEVDQQVASGRYDRELARALFNGARAAGKPITETESARMAAEIEITKGRIARALNVPAEQVVFIEQAGFHIDMETRAIGENRVMVSDLRESLKEIDAAIAELRAGEGAGTKGGIKREVDPDVGKPGTGGDATERELRLLTELRAITEIEIQYGSQAQLDRKARTLEHAGIQVVRAGVNFGGIVSEANFANGIASYDTRGRLYFITNRSPSPTLNRRFEEFMQKRGVAVEWVSTAALLSWMGGIDCITLQKGLK